MQCILGSETNSYSRHVALFLHFTLSNKTALALLSGHDSSQSPTWVLKQTLRPFLVPEAARHLSLTSI